SSLNEGLEALLKNRSKDLERGICELLESTPSKSAAPGDTTQPANTTNQLNLVQAVYDHPLISSLFKGTYKEAKSSGELPSYIPARNFAHALVDIIRTATAKDGLLAPLASDPAAAVAQMRQAAVDFKKFSPRISAALVAVIDAAGNDVEKARQNIEHWF